MSKDLDTKIRETKGLGRDESGSPERYGLDHDGASSMGGARSDVTTLLWKSWNVRQASRNS
jgi:hypothetical protein